MEKYNLAFHDITSNYFHFTSYFNLKSIETVGLIPKIGKHAKYIEKTKKYFLLKV